MTLCHRFPMHVYLNIARARYPLTFRYHHYYTYSGLHKSDTNLAHSSTTDWPSVPRDYRSWQSKREKRHRHVH